MYILKINVMRTPVSKYFTNGLKGVIKQHIKAPHFWPFVSTVTGGLPQKRPVIQRAFSCNDVIVSSDVLHIRVIDVCHQCEAPSWKYHCHSSSETIKSPWYTWYSCWQDTSIKWWVLLVKAFDANAFILIFIHPVPKEASNRFSSCIYSTELLWQQSDNGF